MSQAKTHLFEQLATAPTGSEPAREWRLRGVAWQRVALVAGVMWALSLGGCRQFDLRQDIPWSNAYREKPTKVVAMWSDTVLTQPGKQGVRGFGGRLMFFGEDEQKPFPVKGALTVYAFREQGKETGRPLPDRKFVITAEQFEKHYSKSKMGHSYSVWLPWGPVGGPEEQISLLVRFEPEAGDVLVSEMTRQLLPGIKKPEDRAAGLVAHPPAAPTSGALPAAMGFTPVGPGLPAMQPGTPWSGAPGAPAVNGVRPAAYLGGAPTGGGAGVQTAGNLTTPSTTTATEANAGGARMQTTTLWVPPSAQRLGGAAARQWNATRRAELENSAEAEGGWGPKHPAIGEGASAREASAEEIAAAWAASTNIQGELSPAVPAPPTGAWGNGGAVFYSPQAAPATGAVAGTSAGSGLSPAAMAEVVAAVRQALSEEQAGSAPPATHFGARRPRVLGGAVAPPRSGSIHQRPHPAGWPSSPPTQLTAEGLLASPGFAAGAPAPQR